MQKFNLIVAYTEHTRGIGFNNKLPWAYNKTDMDLFKSITTNTTKGFTNAIIMGRNTWESLPKKPLPGRVNIVITSKSIKDMNNGVETPSEVFKQLNHALTFCNNNKSIESVFVIGGEQLYKEAIYKSELDKIHATMMFKDYECDTFFPKLPGWVKLVSQQTSTASPDQTYKIYQNVADPNSEEQQYLKCLQDILDKGEKVKDRTGVGTLSLFDQNFNFSIDTLNPEEEDQTKLQYKVPGLTTKNLYLRGIIWELIWFLRGDTDAKWLSDKKVNIWNDHTSRQHLDNTGLVDYKEGQLGPGYGHQWINWGGDWSPEKGSSKGINQIKQIIDLLKKSPASRRAVLSAWNVTALPNMALPPCHILYMFKVTDHDKKKKKLNCKMVMRSNDMFLGSPFNIMSTAVLTILISRALDMLPGKIAISISDAHLYLNHLDQAKEQLQRIPLTFPIMKLNKKIGDYDDMIGLEWNDFEFSEYYHWPGIKADMAI